MSGPFRNEDPLTKVGSGSIHGKKQKAARERTRLEEARRRFLIVQYCREHFPDESVREQARMIQEACDQGELEFEKGPSYATLWRWQRTADEVEERGDVLGIHHFEAGRPSGRPPEPIHAEILEFMEREFVQGTIRGATKLHRAACRKAAELGVEGPSESQVRDFVEDYPKAELIAARQGRSAAFTDALIKSTIPTTHPHEVWMLDETMLPVFIREVDPDTHKVVPVRAWVILLIEMHSRVILSYHIVPPFKYGTSPTFTSDDVLGTLLGTALRELAPRPLRPFAGYLPERMRWDRAKAHEALEEDLDGAGIEVVNTIGEMPFRQGRIERPNKTIKGLCEGLRGHIDHDLPAHPSTLREAPEAERRRLAGTKHSRGQKKRLVNVSNLYTLEELDAELLERICAYHEDPHDFLNGRCPMDEYLRARPGGINGRSSLLMMNDKILTVTKAGVDHTYQGNRVRFNPRSMGVQVNVGDQLHCFTDPLMRCLYVRFEDGSIRAMMRTDDWARLDDYAGTAKEQWRRVAASSDLGKALRAQSLDEECGPGSSEEAAERRKEILEEEDQDEGGYVPPRRQGLVAHGRAKLDRARRARRRKAKERGEREKNGQRKHRPTLAGDPRQQIRRK